MFLVKRFSSIGFSLGKEHFLKFTSSFFTLEKNLNAKFQEIIDKNAINYNLINSYLLFILKFQKNLDYSSSQEYIEEIESNLKIYEQNFEASFNLDVEKNMEYALEISKSFQSLTPDLKAMTLRNFIKVIDFLIVSTINLCEKQPLIYNSHVIFLNRLLQIQINIARSKVTLPSLNYFLSYYEKNKKYMEEIPDPIQNIILLVLFFDFKDEIMKNFLKDFDLKEMLIKNNNLVFRNSTFQSLICFLNLTHDLKRIELMNIVLLFFQNNMAKFTFPELFTLLMNLYQLKEDSVKIYLFSFHNELLTRKDLYNELKKRENLKMIHRNIGEIAQKSQKFFLIIVDFLEKNKKLLINDLVYNYLSNIPNKFLKINLLLLFQNHFLEKNKSLDWKINSLALLACRLDERKYLNIELLKLLDDFLIDKIRIIFSDEEIKNYITFLYLLGKNGFWESQHFARIDLFYLRQQDLINKNPENALSLFIFGCKSVFTHNVNYYEILFELLFNHMKNLKKNIFKLKDLANFLYSIAILIAKHNEREIKQENFIYFMIKTLEKIINSKIIKDFSLKQTNQILGDYLNEKMNIEHLVEIYQYLLTQVIFAHKLNLFSCEQYDLKEIMRHDNDKIYNQNPVLHDFIRFDRYIETLDLMKIMKLKNTNLSISVRELLTKMGLKFKIEHQIKMYFVDVLIEPNFVIEIQGNKHYTRENLSIKPKTFLKKMHLESLGYKYMEIAFFDFNQNPLLVENKINKFLKG